MAKMSEREGVSRENVYLVFPEELTIIEDKEHPLYDERVKLPLDAEFVANIRKRGVLQPVLVRRNGDTLEVVDGRQRVRAAIAINEELKKNGGGDPVRVRYRMLKGDDKDMGEVMVIANAFRVEEPPTMRAAKMQRYVDRGYSEAELAKLWNLTPQTIKNTTDLLNCTAKVKKAVDTRAITEGAARELSQMRREEQDGALEKLLEAGQGRGTQSKAAARSIRKTGKAAKKNGAAKKMKPRHWLEGWLLALDELDTKESHLTKAVVNFVLGDPEALADHVKIGATTARVNRDGTLVTDEEEEE